MKILITGATGFIGKKLVEALLPKKHEIICLVRKTSKTDFLEELGISFVVADITDAKETERVFREIKPEVVFHCAARVAEEDYEVLYKINIEGTLNITRVCYKNNVRKYIYLSSVAVISGNLEVPLTEDLPYIATNAYGKTKVEAEQIVKDFREKGLNTSVIRPCIVYGEDEPHALNKIFRWARSRRLPIFDVPGMDSKLHLVYVGNVVQALVSALEKEEAYAGTFMIADKEPITLRKFVEIVYAEMTGKYPPVVPSWVCKILLIFPSLKKKADRLFKDRVYDITNAVNKLGYDPKISTEDGLRKTVRHWKDMSS